MSLAYRRDREKNQGVASIELISACNLASLVSSTPACRMIAVLFVIIIFRSYFYLTDSPVIILEALDIIFAQICARMYFNNL